MATETELIAGCKRGKSSVQRLLFEQYAGKMMSICRRYCKDKMEAEDMLQVGFIKVFEKIGQVSGGSLEGWMKKVFVNTCLTQWYKNKSSILSIEENPAEEIDDAEDGLQKLMANELIALLDQLPPGAKMVFNLYAIEGFPHTEIAIMLNISEGASRAQLAKARQMLQGKLRKKI
jgi:RNA polymerase sigma-70 factor (ECF subfamily)